VQRPLLTFSLGILPHRLFRGSHALRVAFECGDSVFVDPDAQKDVLMWVMGGALTRPICKLQVGQQRVYLVISTDRCAPPGGVVCPLWVFEVLGASSGDAVQMSPINAPLVDYVRLAPHDPDFFEKFPRGADYTLTTVLSEGRVQVLAPPFNDGFAPTPAEGGVTAHWKGQPLPLLVKPSSADFEGPPQVFWFDVEEVRVALRGRNSTGLRDEFFNMDDAMRKPLAVVSGTAFGEFDVAVDLQNTRKLVNGHVAATPVGFQGLRSESPVPSPVPVGGGGSDGGGGGERPPSRGRAGSTASSRSESPPVARTRLELGQPYGQLVLGGDTADEPRERAFFATCGARSGLRVRVTPAPLHGGGGGGGPAPVSLPELFVSLAAPQGVDVPSARRFMWADLAHSGGDPNGEKVLLITPHDPLLPAPPPPPLPQPAPPPAPPPPPPVAEPPPSKACENLMKNSFSREHAEFALARTGGNYDRALDFLLENNMDQLLRAVAAPPPPLRPASPPRPPRPASPEKRTFSFCVAMPAPHWTSPFLITATEVTAPAEDGVAEAGGGAAPAAVAAPEPGDVQCVNCGAWVPGTRMPLHEARCARAKRCGACRRLLSPGEEARHFHCPTPAAGCATEVFPTADAAARHAEVYHGAFPCEDCGAEGMTRGVVYEGHLAGACPRRLVACTYCAQKKFRAEKLAWHEEACGAKTVDCPTCKRTVVRRDMARHLVSGCAPPRSPERVLRLGQPSLPPGGGSGGGGGGGGGVSEAEVAEVVAKGAEMGMQWTPQAARRALANIRGLDDTRRVVEAARWLFDNK